MPHIPAYQPTCLLCGREGAAALTPGPMLRCVHCGGSMTWESCYESANVLGLIRLAALVDLGETDAERAERRATNQRRYQQDRERPLYQAYESKRQDSRRKPTIPCRGCGKALRETNSRERGTCSWCHKADTRAEERAYTRPRRNDHAASL